MTERKEITVSRDSYMSVLSSLAAAISILERSPKTAAASDRMFDTCLDDYRRALDLGRAELTAMEKRND